MAPPAIIRGRTITLPFPLSEEKPAWEAFLIADSTV